MILNLNVELSTIFPIQKRNHKPVSVKFPYIISPHLSKSYYCHESFLIHTWHSVHWNPRENVLILGEEILLQFCTHSNDLIENRKCFATYLQEEWFWFAEALIWERKGRWSNNIPGKRISPLSILHMFSRNGRRAFSRITPLRRAVKKVLFEIEKNIVKQKNALSTWFDIVAWVSSSAQ